MKPIKSILIISFVFAVAALCQSCEPGTRQAHAEVNEVEESTAIEEAPPAEVETMVVEQSDFYHEILSNGKLTANQKADLHFTMNEKIRKINYSNGQRVSRGDTIATLYNSKLKNKLDQANLNFERSKLTFYDQLIAQGYDHNREQEVPEEVLNMLQIKSGYAAAANDLEMARLQYGESFLIAPVSGVVANLYDKENNYPTSNKPFCTILNDRVFEVIFQVMESEITMIQPGELVEVVPYYAEKMSLDGKVKEVNPVVDKSGLVTLTALVQNQQNALFEGMNVKVSLKLPVRDKIVLPKEAVTIRSEKPVVFTFKMDPGETHKGQAQWVYVTTGAENNNSIVIEESIYPGDTIIYKGNIHLAHGSRVVVVE